MSMIWIVTCTVTLITTVECINMINGSLLNDNLFTDAVVLIQRKPATTVCFGIVIDEQTVYTAATCEIGNTEPPESYHIVEHFIPNNTYNIADIQRGKEWPFDLKVIKLSDPFHLCEYGCTPKKVEWLKLMSAYERRFKQATPAVVFAFGPPFKAGIQAYSQDEDCRNRYAEARDSSWPQNMSQRAFCVYPGPEPSMIPPVPEDIQPAFPCDDSVGSSIVIIQNGLVFGIILKGFCGTKKLAIALGSYHILTNPFTPDVNWAPFSLTKKTTIAAVTTTETTSIKAKTNPKIFMTRPKKPNYYPTFRPYRPHQPTVVVWVLAWFFCCGCIIALIVVFLH